MTLPYNMEFEQNDKRKFEIPGLQKGPLPGSSGPYSLSKNLIFDRLAEGKKGPKTSKPKASAYIGTVVLWFAQ